MMFYIVFSLVILARPAQRLAALVVAFCGIVLLGLLTSPAEPQLWYWTRPIILEFLAGGLIAHAYMRGWTMPPVVSFVLLVAGLVGLQLSGSLPDPTEYSTRAWAWGIPSAAIVASVTLTERSVFDLLPRRFATFAVRLGDGSYSLYLVHMFVIRATTLVLSKLHLSPLPYTFICYVVVIVGSFALADILYRHVEIRLNSLGRRFVPAKA
jgi:peptidoglycan/LPS O-acetylase OafA/YrhL